MNQIFDAGAIQLNGLDASSLSDGGLVISPKKALASLGYGDLSALASCNSSLINGDIQKSKQGIIQDPAGSAIGDPTDPAKIPGVGGASKVIYAEFTDLKPIPNIPVGASVFNTSAGLGRRVLHTYSPSLAGSPKVLADCQSAVELLANAYFNALSCANHPPAALAGSDDAALVNLIPLAGSIFAYQFKFVFDRQLGLAHLHPSYTLLAIALAQLALARAGETVLPTALFYHDQLVYDAAVPLIDQIYPPQTVI